MARFSETLLEYARFPSNHGPLPGATHSGRASLDGNPPFIEIHLLVAGDIVQQARFESHGCGVTTAICSMTTEMIEGKSLAQCRELTVEQIQTALDGIPADKLHCAHVCMRALLDALPPPASP